MATISKYQTLSGTTVYRVCYRTPEGRQTDKRGFSTKRDAQAFAAAVEGPAEPAGRRIRPVSRPGAAARRRRAPLGRAAALRVGDVDFLRRRVQLQRNAVMVSDRVIVGPLKSHKNRTVALPAFVIDALSVTAAGKGRDELLWSTAAGTPLGPPAQTSWLSYAVARCQKADKSFPRVTAHGLRHTAASLAIHAGANPLVVQRILVGGDDAGHLRRFVRVRPRRGGRKCGQNMGMARRFTLTFDAEKDIYQRRCR